MGCGSLTWRRWLLTILSFAAVCTPAHIAACGGATAKRLEGALGRDPQGPRWGPRVIDLDILSFDGLCVTDTEHDLIVPHPRFHERRFALPLIVSSVFFLLLGISFAYYFVLPNAIDFLQNFNDDNFDILLQARDYYKFSIMVLMVMGILFGASIAVFALAESYPIALVMLLHRVAGRRLLGLVPRPVRDLARAFGRRTSEGAYQGICW